MQTIHAPRVAPLDPNRIAAITGAIAINGLLLALLVAPTSAPVMKSAEPELQVVVIPPPVHVVPPVPVPVPITAAHQQPPTPHPAPTVVQHPVDPPPIADHAEPGDTVVPPSDSHAVTHETRRDAQPADDGKPMAGAHLEYATNPAPSYPHDELMNGDTGTVLLEVLVDVDGRPMEVSISRSSGHRALDLAAKRTVLSSWRFKPAMRDGRAVQAIGLVPVEFKLQ